MNARLGRRRHAPAQKTERRRQPSWRGHLGWLATLLLVAGAPAQADPVQVEQGRRIYQEGVLTDGAALRATGAGGIDLIGAKAACIACHRRSGMGSREGSVLISPVTGTVLFNKPVPYWPSRPGRATQKVAPLRQFARDAYDAATLARAIRSGVDPNGRPLDALMPRYTLNEADAAALTAYLQRLSVAPPPGLSAGTLHLATLITSDADPLRANVVAETLTTWSRSGALGGIPLHLQVWRLTGPPSTWSEQLERFNREQPVYAVLSGAGSAQWAPVRDFCERVKLPCLFPVVDLGVSAPTDFYTLYFSTGVPLEARILARTIDELSPRPTRVVQIVADEAGEAGAAGLAERLRNVISETRRWRDDAPANLIGDLKAGDVLVGWLGLEQLRRLTESRQQGPGTDRILFSAQLGPPGKADLPLPWRQVARWVSVRSDPRRVQGRGVMGLVPWLAHMKLSAHDESLLSEVYAATYFFGDALARMRGNWNREFLLETLESANYARPAGSAFFALSLAAGQREAAKAGQLLSFEGPHFRRVVPIGPRIAP